VVTLFTLSTKMTDSQTLTGNIFDNVYLLEVWNGSIQ